HKYKEDVKLMVETGLDAYRLSISWSRLIPNGRGPINPKGLQFYNNLINELISSAYLFLVCGHCLLLNAEESLSCKNNRSNFKMLCRSALHKLRYMQVGLLEGNRDYAYIYTSDGMSLYELAMFILKERKYTAKYNDDLCVVCWDGGNLLLCDGCPRSFHKDNYLRTELQYYIGNVQNVCQYQVFPRGNWYCQICQNMFQRESFVADNVHAVAAERVEGVGPIEQIARCIRIVKDSDAEMGGCVLCGGSDFSRSGFGPRTIIFCDQCKKEYHVGCLRDHKMAFLKELPEGIWICCDDCTRIHSILENILIRGPERLPESLLDVIKVK
ncbi:hypothetical protein HN873_071612, partial [Arachis hypogaea]